MLTIRIKGGSTGTSVNLARPLSLLLSMWVLTWTLISMGRLSLRNALDGQLSAEELTSLSQSFDVVGDIAVLRLPSSLRDKGSIIAEAIAQVNGHIRTVLNQVSPVRGERRLRRLEWVWGEKRTETLYREHGCVFKVDLSEVYFSPRLSFERMRVAKLVRAKEEVVNMFAGVGCFSILMAKHCETGKIYSIDVNPRAVRLMWENIALNRVAERVEAILGDAKDVIHRELEGVADRVLMPLPRKAYEYLGSAVTALDSGTGFIHYYDFIHVKSSEDPLQKIIDRIKAKMMLLGVSFEVLSSRVVRTIGSNWCQIALDIKVCP